MANFTPIGGAPISSEKALYITKRITQTAATGLILTPNQGTRVTTVLVRAPVSLGIITFNAIPIAGKEIVQTSTTTLTLVPNTGEILLAVGTKPFFLTISTYAADISLNLRVNTNLATLLLTGANASVLSEVIIPQTGTQALVLATNPIEISKATEITTNSPVSLVITTFRQATITHVVIPQGAVPALSVNTIQGIVQVGVGVNAKLKTLVIAEYKAQIIAVASPNDIFTHVPVLVAAISISGSWSLEKLLSAM